MIFATAEKKPAMFLMLSEKDVTTMREGRTVFVDERFTKGHLFNTVILSLHPTDEAAADMLRRSGAPAMSDTRQPHEMYTVKPGEGVCTGCHGFMGEPLLYETLCTQCWANLAKGFRVTVYCRPRTRTPSARLFKAQSFIVHACTGHADTIEAAWKELYGHDFELSPAGLGPIEPMPRGGKKP